MTMMNLDSDVNLLSLKQPEITTLTQVQPHGVLLVLQESDLSILQVSANSRKTLGLPPEEVLGKTLDEVLDVYQVEQFRAGLQYENLDVMNPTKVWVRRRGDDYAVYDAIFHRNEAGLF
jgi:chemotaxis family two-component system sensor kinase Cph1